MVTRKSLAVLIAIVIFGIKIYSQEEKAAEISFVYPIGTGGISAYNYSYKFSFNVIAGLNGGVNGCEIGSVANINKGNVSGGQLSGVFNITTGNSKGAIISGVLNTSASLNGFQLSTINVAYKTMNGLQLGVVNYANKAKGTQLGVINISNETDSIIPIGLINVVKGGYFGFELSTNELLLTSLSYKMGVEKFHTLLRAGAGLGDSKDNYLLGFGFGSIIPIKNNHKLNVELISDHLIYDNKWDNTINLLNQLNINYQYQITDYLSVKVGPGIRNYVTNQKVNGKLNTIEVPYSIFKYTEKNINTSIWIGINGGIVISL